MSSPPSWGQWIPLASELTLGGGFQCSLIPTVCCIDQRSSLLLASGHSFHKHQQKVLRHRDRRTPGCDSGAEEDEGCWEHLLESPLVWGGDWRQRVKQEAQGGAGNRAGVWGVN